MIAPRRLYVTADRSRVVFEGDPLASFLLAPKGVEIPESVVKRYGLDRPNQDEVPKANPESRQKRIPRNITTR